MFGFRNASSTLILVLFVLALGSACENYTGNIEGQVLLEEELTPLEGISVTAHSYRDGRDLTTTTDADGYYFIGGARYGPNRVQTEHERYLSRAAIIDVLKDETRVADFELIYNPPSTEIDVTFFVFAFDAFAAVPIEGARIDIYLEIEETGFEFQSTVVTDEFGEASFPDDQVVREEIPELYEVRVSAIGYYNAAEQFTVTYEEPKMTVRIQLDPVDGED